MKIVIATNAPNGILNHRKTQGNQPMIARNFACRCGTGAGFFGFLF